MVDSEKALPAYGYTIGVVGGLLRYLGTLEGNLTQAKCCFQKTLTIARHTENRWREAWILDKLGILYWTMGRLREAETHAEDAKDLFKIIGSKEN